MAIVIAGTREDWPGGPRTLTPREPTREPNGTLWFGAELDPDGDQVWFRIAPAAVARMPAATPADRGRLLVDALIFWGAPPPRHLARRPAARGRHPGRVPRRTPRPGPGAGERGDDGGRGVLPARLASEPSPAGERTARVLAGYRRTAGSRGRGQARPVRGRRTWPPSAPPAAPARLRPRVREVALKLHVRDAAERGERAALGRQSNDAADGDGVLVTVRRGKTNQDGETSHQAGAGDLLGEEEPPPQCEVCGGPGPDDSRFTCDWCDRVCGQCCAVVDALLPTCVSTMTTLPSSLVRRGASRTPTPSPAA